MYKKLFKRLFDIIISLVAMPFVLLVIVIFAPIIYFTDKGPVFYNAQRIGKDGKPFKMYKLRSMYVNSPDIRLSDGSTYNGEDDPRVTPIGRFMRETSIDELPQIINVLQGRMSLIGPRPDPLDWMERYPEEVKVFLTVRPGITGYTQAYFRNSVDGTEKMYQDAYYAQNCTFKMDVKILFKTVGVVLKRENTYRDTTDEADVENEVMELRKKLDQNEEVDQCAKK
jgi:lipopolysaccharide/colanic/teichoic acid biosynthesis glycosyltransferase